MSGTGASGQPGRYSRSVNGLIGAMLVTVVAVVGVVTLGGLTRDDAPLDPTPVEYLSLVRDVQAGGTDLVYPSTLPEGWVATDVDYDPASAAFGLSVLTDDDQYVGLRVEDAPVEDLLEELVDEDWTEADPLRFEDGPDPEVVATDWDGYADDGGDLAYAAEVDDRQVLVYGSADPAELSGYVARLTAAPVGEAPAG